MQSVEDVLLTFREAFETGDHKTWAVLYDKTVTLMRPHQTVTYDGPDAMYDIGRNVYDAYCQLGMTRVELKMSDPRGFDPGVRLIDAQWRYLTATGAEIIVHDVTYGLRRRAGGYKIALHITHNEAARRPIFLETADPDKLIGGSI